MTMSLHRYIEECMRKMEAPVHRKYLVKSSETTLAAATARVDDDAMEVCPLLARLPAVPLPLLRAQTLSCLCVLTE